MVPLPTNSTPTPDPAGGINESDLSLACMAMFLLMLPVPTNSTPTPDPAGGINESRFKSGVYGYVSPNGSPSFININTLTALTVLTVLTV